MCIYTSHCLLTQTVCMATLSDPLVGWSALYCTTRAVELCRRRRQYEQLEIGSPAHQWRCREGAFGEIVDRALK